VAAHEPCQHGHWRTTTCVADLRLDGLDAPMPIDGLMNADAFLAHIRHGLSPTLQPGEVVIIPCPGVPRSTVELKTNITAVMEAL